MVSEAKLIKVGVKYSDSFFEQLKKIYGDAYRDADSLEEFLNETRDYSISNPLETSGYKDQMVDLIVSSTNNIKYSRPAQKALMQTIIRNTTGELITNVGEDIKAGVRDIVSRGYREGKLNHVRVADEISSTLDGINHKRARTIARTEIKRAQTTSNYTVALERGANAYKYKCGAKPCDICKVDCGKTYPITDLEHLPPRHPNCMCGISFFKDPNLPMPDEQTTEPVEPTKTTKPTGETQPINESKTDSKFISLAKNHKEIEFKGKENEYNVFINTHDNSLIKFEDTISIKDVENYLKDYDNLHWLYKRNAGEISFIDKEVNTHAYGQYFSNDKSISVYLDNFRKDKDKIGKQGVNYVVSHEMSHAIDLNSPTSFTGKTFSLKRKWQKAMNEDSKRFKDLDIESYYGTGENKIPFRPHAGKNVNHELFLGTETTVAYEDFADSLGVQMLKPGETIITDLGELTKEEWNKSFPNRAELAQDILTNPMKYGLDNSHIWGEYGTGKPRRSWDKVKETPKDNAQETLERLNRKVSRYEKSVKKYSKFDKKLADRYQVELNKAKQELVEFKKNM